MSTSQIALLIVFNLIIGGGMFYVKMQPKTKVLREAECVAAATAVPLVNTTTGMGMTKLLLNVTEPSCIS